MADSNKSAAKQGRKRILHIIYFIDSARTRSFRIPLERLHILLTFIFLLLVWAVANVFLVVGMLQERQQLVGRLSEAMTTIFEYETRYDGVYEIAYPSKNGKPTTAVSAKELAEATRAAGKRAQAKIAKGEQAQPQDQATKTPPKEPPAKQVAAEPATTAKPKTPPPKKEPPQKVEVAETKPEATPKPDPTATPEPEKTAVTVENPTVEAMKDKVQLKFKIENQKSPKRAEGYIWLAASFEADDGEKTWLPAPEPIQVNAEGNPMYPTKAYRYSIRYYKTEELTFRPPGGKAGKFTAIRIGLTDSKGEAIETYNIPVDLPVEGTSAKETSAPAGEGGNDSGSNSAPGSSSNSAAPANSETSGSNSPSADSINNRLAEETFVP